LNTNTTEWGWKIPFALQWMFPLPLLIVAFWCPPSPWWLVRRGRRDEAVAALRRLGDDTVNHEDAVALIEHTVNLEREFDFGSSYASCFKGVDRRRTEIAVVCWVAQVLVGWSISGYQAYFFKLAGMAQGDSFKLTLGSYCVAFVGTSSAMALQIKFGRRSLWFGGLIAMFASMIVIGILACLPQTTAMLWAEGSMVLVWFGNYGVSLV
jgi:SP family general alpha glucoside:H+ symporter-like MFS transporter